MRHLLRAFLITAALFTAPVRGQDTGGVGDLTTEQLQEQAPDLHPAGLYLLSSRLLAEGKGQEAANWMYAGQLRYRFLLEAEGEPGSNEVVLFGAMSEQVGRPVNEYIAGDVDEWLDAMDWALAWDAVNGNATTSKTEHGDALAKTRMGLEEFRASIEDRRDIIPQEREANGLENR